MHKIIKIVCLFSLLFMMSAGITYAADASDYRLAPNDVLMIDLWGYDPPQEKQYLVRKDGKVSFPAAGEQQAAGLTVPELTANITAALSRYMIDPKVSVNVVKYHTTRVYVFGEVNKPGMYEIERQHNLLDAIGMAAGYNKDAAKKKIFILHKDSQDKPIVANLLQLLRKGDMSQNYALNDGDVVYLTSNGRIDFARDILPWISGVYQVHEATNDN